MSHPPITHGLARSISRALAACELEHLARQTFDLALAARQHDGYVRALEAAGVRMKVLREEPDLPDSNFVEDPVVVLDELAIICRLARPSRQPEARIIEPEIARLRPVVKIEAPGTLEGGDVLRIGKTLFVGRSSRTNREGIDQLRRITSSHGYEVVEVAVNGCLHLKTAVTSPGNGLILANAAWIDLSPFAQFEILAVPAAEPWGANTLSVNGRVFVAASSPQTAALLGSRGLDVHRLDVSELQKAEAGLTCQSLLFK